jgi:hypothetical protein
MTMTTVQAAAQSKFEAMIAAGRGKALAGMESLAKEWKLRHDFIAKPEAIDVGFRADEMTVEVKGHGGFGLTRHARNQLLSHASIPVAFADTLVEHDLRDLLRSNVRDLLARTAPTGLLVREVEGTAKGIMSSAYRRMDASPMFDSFVQSALRMDLLPHDGLITDTRAFVSFLRPEIVEVLPGEFVVFAVELRNSDYGNGALDLSLALWRLLCTNGAIGTSMFRKVHLGRRFDGFGDGQDSIKLSARTENLDLATLRSALSDSIKALPGHIEAQVTALRETATKEMNLNAALAKLTKSGLRKATVERVKSTYQMAMPVEALPEMPGAWRFSNVLSLLANDPNLPGDEAHDLREIAGQFILPAKASA